MAGTPFLETPPVFGSDGTLQGNLTSNFGQTPAPNFDSNLPELSALPSLPSAFAPSATSAGNVVTSFGGANAASAVAPTSPASAVPSNAQASAQPAPASGVTSGSIADYFYRAVIVILGFIFVAIGLNMFKPGIVPVPGLPGRH